MLQRRRPLALGCGTWLLVVAALAGQALAGPLADGRYEGQLQCGAALEPPTRAGWTSPVQLDARGDTLRWQRGNHEFSESASATWSRGAVAVDALGAWAAGSARQGQWRTVGTLRVDGATLSGSMRQLSVTGERVLRECRFSAAVAVVASAPRTPPPPPAAPAPAPYDPARAPATEACAWQGGAACTQMLAADARAQAGDAAATPSPASPAAPAAPSLRVAPSSLPPVAPPPTASAASSEPSPGVASVPPSAATASPPPPPSIDSARVAEATTGTARDGAFAAEPVGEARRYLPVRLFGEHWIAWTVLGALLTVWLPLSFLLANPAASLGPLSALRLLDIFNRSGKIRPFAATGQAWGMLALFGLAMCAIGPLIIWFNAGVPWLHERDGAARTLCCVEEPRYTGDMRFALDLYRDDPALPWHAVKALLGADANGPWKLRVLDIGRGAFIDLRGFGKTEDDGAILVLGRNDQHLELDADGERLRVLVARSTQSVLEVPAAGVGLAHWPPLAPPTAGAGEVDFAVADALRKAHPELRLGEFAPASGGRGTAGTLVVAREQPDEAGLLGALRGLWSLVATRSYLHWFDPASGAVRYSAALFGRARYVGATPDGTVQVFTAPGGYLKLVRLPAPRRD